VVLFVYGTLMVPSVMCAVSGFRGPGRAAVLHDHVRRRVVGEVYPGIVSRAGESVSGLVYVGLSGPQMHRLDLFEGEAYRRVELPVTMDDGQTWRAHTYVMAAGHERHLSREAWSLDEFLRRHLDRFVGGYRGFSDLARNGEGGGDDGRR